jgi:NAD(P)-dependent dehydrogenase (short-subunit alcohol dehydrogenase family)
VLDERLGLAGRVVMVAGAGGGGIGTAVCRVLAEADATVVALDLDAGRLAVSEEAMDAVGGRYETRIVDVCDADALDATMGSVTGPLHGLVHVAGGLHDHWAPLLTTDPVVFGDVVRLNLESAFLTSRAVAGRLATQAAGGSIVHIASIAGLSAMPFGAAYAAAKAGMMALTRTAALEWGPLGIRVNAVAPGTIRTPRSRSERDLPVSPAEHSVIPLGRQGRPEDIAGAVLFLLSDLAAFVSGAVLVVDGGSSARPSYLDADNLPVFVRDPALRARLGLTGPG